MMKRGDKGFTLIELMVAMSIMAVASVAAGMAIYQVFGGTEKNTNQMTALNQVQNVGYWVSRDSLMAVSINTTDNLSYPDFLHIGWTEWDDEGSPTYHTTNYTLEYMDTNIYAMKRSHSVSGGSTDQMIIAEYIYYDPGEEYTSNTTYLNRVLLVNITSIFDEIRETREYRIKRRAGL